MRTALRITVAAAVLMLAARFCQHHMGLAAELGALPAAVTTAFRALAILVDSVASMTLLGGAIYFSGRLVAAVDVAASPEGGPSTRGPRPGVTSGRAFARATLMAVGWLTAALGAGAGLTAAAGLAFGHDMLGLAAVMLFAAIIALAAPFGLLIRIGSNLYRWARFVRARRTLRPSPLAVMESAGRLFAIDRDGRSMALVMNAGRLGLDIPTTHVPLGGLTIGPGPVHGETPGLRPLGDRTEAAALVVSRPRRDLVRFVLDVGGAIDDGRIRWAPKNWGPGPDGVPALLARLTLAHEARQGESDDPIRHLIDGALDETDVRWRLARLEQLRRLDASPDAWARLLEGPADLALAARIILSPERLSIADVAELLDAAGPAVDTLELARALAGIARRSGIADLDGLIALGEVRPGVRAELIDAVAAFALDPEPVLLRWLPGLEPEGMLSALVGLERRGSRSVLPALAGFVEHPSPTVARAARRADQAVRARVFAGGVGTLALMEPDDAGALALAGPAPLAA